MRTVISGCRRPGMALWLPLVFPGARGRGGTPPGSNVPGAAGTASAVFVGGLRRSRRDAHCGYRK
ncbi:hypothetical protein BJY54_005216 [Streptomyces nodosus]|nr:hypothetical protein [Streptomyces nodosus]